MSCSHSMCIWFLQIFKGELGGPVTSKYMTGVFLVFLWCCYIVVSTLVAYDVIPIALWPAANPHLSLLRQLSVNIAKSTHRELVWICGFCKGISSYMPTTQMVPACCSLEERSKDWTIQEVKEAWYCQPSLS